MTLEINPRINQTVMSSEEIRLIILKSSKVIRKLTKKTVLTKKGRMKFAAMYEEYSFNIN
tara:strand:+ start:8146 stop:8325 length:180 start_codon:yes stop_codon:yes gene_type:complete